MANVNKPLLTDPEIMELLKAAMPYSRDYLMLKLLINTGMRINELLKTRVKDINLNDRIITIPATNSKNGDTGDVSFTVDTLPYLQQWITNNKLKDNSLLFDLSPRMAQYLIKKYAASAGIQKVITPHSLRHWYATKLLRADVERWRVKKFMRHKDMRSLEVYDHMVTHDMLKQYDEVMKGY
jgi:integrase/recombinase XerD